MNRSKAGIPKPVNLSAYVYFVLNLQNLTLLQKENKRSM